MRGFGCSGCERERRVAAGAAVSVECEGVDGERVGEQVEPLPRLADGVGSAKPEGVVECPVDGLGVVASGVQRPERRVGGRDGSDVLGPVELPHAVFVVAVEADDDDAAAEVVGQPVVVVPAKRADLVGLAAGADAGEFGEELLPGVGEGEDADGPGAGEQVDSSFGAVGEGDGALFDERGLLDPFLVALLAVGSGALRGGDLVDGEQRVDRLGSDHPIDHRRSGE